MKQDALPVLLLIGVILIVFGLPVILGYSLLPSYSTPSVFPSGFYHEPVRSPTGSLTVDPTASLQMLPWDKMAGDDLKKGNIPLWNPYSLTGMPFMANIQSAFLFPLQTLQDIMPSYMWSFMYMVRFFAAGVFTFLFLRRIGLESLAAVSGSMVFVLSGTVALYFRLEPAFNSYITLPVVLYFYERLSGQWSGKNLLLAALSFSFLIISGQPEISILNALFAGCYSFFRGWRKHAAGCKKGEAFSPLAMYPIGLLMAMPLLLPVLEYFQNADTGRAEFGKMYLNARIMVLQVMPYLLGHVGHYISPDTKGIFSWNYIGGYIGVIGFYLAILGVLSRGGKAFNGISKFMMISAGILLMKIYGFPLLQWLGALPVLKQFWITRYSGAALTMCFATLAAAGTQEILTNTNAEMRKRAFIATLILILTLLLPVAGLIKAKLNTLALGSLATTFGFMALLWFLVVRKNTGREAFAAIILLSAELMVLAQYGLKLGAEQYRIASVLILLAGVILASGRKRLAAGLLVIVSITAMSATLIISKKGPPVNGDLFKGSSFITFLKERQLNNYGRTFALDGFLSGNFHSAFGIYGLNCCEALVPRNIKEFSKRYLDPNANPLYFDGDSGFRTGGSAREALLTNKKYYDLIGLRYIITSPDKGLFEGPERKFPEKKQNVAVGFSPGESFSSKVRMENDELSGIRVFMATYARKNSGSIVLTIKDSLGAVQAVSARDAGGLVDNAYNDFRFDPVRLKKGTDLILEWKYTNGAPGAAVAFWCEPGMNTGYELTGSLQFSGILPFIVQEFDGEFVKVYDDREVRIWENPSAFPRAFVVHDVKVAGSSKEALAMMENLDMKNQAVITSKESSLVFSNKDIDIKTEAKVKGMDAHTITITLESARRGLLVIPDTYYPGWVAKADGKVRPIYEADGAFRGIFLENGDKEIVVEYKPKSFLYGTAVSIASIFCCLVPWRRLKRNLPSNHRDTEAQRKNDM